MRLPAEDGREQIRREREFREGDRAALKREYWYSLVRSSFYMLPSSFSFGRTVGAQATNGCSCRTLWRLFRACVGPAAPEIKQQERTREVRGSEEGLNQRASFVSVFALKDLRDGL